MKPLTVREACAELRCSRWTLDRLFKAGKLTKVTDGRTVYVDPAELRTYIRSYGTVGSKGHATSGRLLTDDEWAALRTLAEIAKEHLGDSRRTAA